MALADVILESFWPRLRPNRQQPLVDAMLDVEEMETAFDYVEQGELSKHFIPPGI